MRLTLNRFSALSVHRAIRNGAVSPDIRACGLREPSCEPRRRWSRKLLAENPVIAATGYPRRPLYAACGDQALRLQVDGVTNTVYSRDLPPDSFVNVCDGVAISSPELLFVEMAPLLSPANHLMMGLELCGTFSRDALDPRDGPVLYQVAPLTSVARIAAFLEDCRGIRGVRAARATLERLHDNAWASTEAVVATMFSLPLHELGYELGELRLNDRLEVGEGPAGAQAGSRVPDILVEGASVGVNYDGLDHLDLDSVAWASAVAAARPDDSALAGQLELAKARVRAKVVDDLRRNRELGSRGLMVMPITKEDLWRKGGLDAVALQLMSAMERLDGRDYSLHRRLLANKALAAARQELLWSLLPGERGRQLGRLVSSRRPEVLEFVVEL